MDQTLSQVYAPGSRGVVPVSVVIPCYRSRPGIRAAVDSVVNQTARPFEIVLVEDFSGDGGQTLALLESIQLELQGVMSVLVLALPENRGAGEARNAGWAAAGQEFVAFLDDDDTWHPRKLELQVTWMLSHPEYVLTCHDSKVFSDTQPSQVANGWISERELGWRLFLFNNEIATRTVILRRSIVQRFPVGVRHAEDFQLWSRILLDGGRALRLRAPLAYSYKNDYGAGGLSGDLAAMHYGVLACLGELRRDGMISRAMHLLAGTYEILKYWRRIAVSAAIRWKTAKGAESSA